MKFSQNVNFFLKNDFLKVLINQWVFSSFDFELWLHIKHVKSKNILRIF